MAAAREILVVDSADETTDSHDVRDDGRSALMLDLVTDGAPTKVYAVKVVDGEIVLARLV